MWQVDNRTPFASHGYLERDRNGIEHWVVAVRACFRVRADGLVEHADDQRPVRPAPEYVGEDASELLAESDFAPFRPKADILLDGFACGLDERPATSRAIRLRVGLLEKRARVFGRRTLRRGAGRRASPVVGAAEPFERLRLSWRAALGGTDPFAVDLQAAAHHPDNPIGVGWTERWRDLPEGAEIVLPSVEAIEKPVTPDAPLPTPQGFGPLQRAWRPRLQHAGTYDDAWEAERAPLLPRDFSETFHQAAPADQVYPDVLRGGEPVEIEGLHPDGAYGFRLPQIILEARTRIDRERTVERPRLVSLTLNGTDRTLDMTWNSHVPCNGRDHKVEGSTVIVRQIAGVAR